MASKLSVKFLTSPRQDHSLHKSALTENCCNSSTEEPTENQVIQEFSLKEILPARSNSHTRMLSQPINMLTPELLFGHKRQKSLGQRPLGHIYDTSNASSPKLEEIEIDKFNYYNHSRKVSDCDMVVYADNRELMISSYLVKRSLPVFGSNPCTAYCKDCDREVSTRVEFTQKSTIPFTFLDFISSFFACCGEPTWLLKLRVHKCGHCGRILARSCK